MNAGEVFVRLGALFEGHNFDKYDRANARAATHRDKSVKLKADFDGRGFDLFNRASKQAEGGLISLGSRLPLVKWGALGAGAVAAAVALTQLTAAVAPLSGALAALPAGASAAVQGIASILLATRGVGTAVTAVMQAQNTASRDAVGNLQRNRSAAESVRSAEMSLQQAKRSSKLAEEELTRARREAIRELEDMKLAAEGAAEGETAAQQALVRARQNLARVEGDPTSRALDLAEAQERVREAITGVKSATLDSSRAEEDYNRARDKGFKGTDRYRSAQRGVTQAHRSENEALRSLRLTIRDTNLALSQATGGTLAVQDAMQNLPARARQFVNFLVGLRPKLHELRETAADNLFPGLEMGITGAMKNLPVFNRLVGETSGAVGQLSAEFGTALGSRGWGKDLTTQGERNVTTITRLGRALWSIIEAVRHYTLASGRLQDFLSRNILLWARQREENAKAARESGQAAATFDNTIRVMQRLAAIGQNLWATFRNIGHAANDSATGGDTLLRALVRLTQRMEDWTGSARGQRDMIGLFDGVRGATSRVFQALGDLISRYRELRREGKNQMDALAIVMGETISRAIENAVRLMGENGPRVAKAFIEGFLAADIWGKLFIGGWLLRRLGGQVAFAAAGATAAKWLTGGMIARGAAGAGGAASAEGVGAILAGGGAATGLRAGLGVAARRAGAAGLGIALIAGISAAFGDKSEETSFAGKVNNFLRGAFGKSARDFPKQASDIRRRILRGLQPRGSDEERELLALNPDPAIRRNIRDQYSGDSGLSDDVRRQLNRLREIRRSAEKLFGERIVLRLGVNERDLFRIKQNFKDMKEGGTFSVKELKEAVDVNLDLITRNMDTHTAEGQRVVTRNFRAAMIAVKNSLQAGRISTGEAMRAIEMLMDKHSFAGRQATRTNFVAAVRTIRTTMAEGGKVTDKGMDAIRRIMLAYLESFGIKGREARLLVKTYDATDIARMTGGDTRLPDQHGGGQGHSHGAATGGIIGRWGERGRDRVPIVVGRGEAILNWAQQMIVNTALRARGMTRGLRDVFAMTSGIRHGYQTGGMVSIPGTGQTIDRRILPDVTAIMRRFRTTVNAGYAPTGHAAGGEHPLGLATDMIPGRGGTWGMVDQLAQFAEPSQNNPRYPWRWVGYTGDPDHGPGNHIHLSWLHGPGFPAAWVATMGGKLRGIIGGRIPRMKLRGPDSAFKAYAQRGLDVVRLGAQRRMNQVLQTPMGGQAEGHEPSPDGPTGSDAGLMQRIARARGWNFGDWWEVDRRESAHGTNLYNEGSGAALRGQFMPGLTQGHYGPGSAPWLHPSMTQQIWSMARYIKERYGNPTKALEHHNAFNWYDQGGVAGFQGGGWAGLPDVLTRVPGATPPAAQGSQFAGLPAELQVTDQVEGSLPVGGNTLKDVASNVTSRVGALRGNIRGYIQQIARLGDDYKRRSTFYDQSEELIVLNPGDRGYDPATAEAKTGFKNGPYIDQSALDKKTGELQDLVKVQTAIQKAYRSYIQSIARMVRIYRGAQHRLRELITSKMPKGKAQKYRNQITAFGRAIKNLRGNIYTVRGDRADAWLGLQDILQELNTLTPDAQREVDQGRADLAGSAGDDPNVQAQLEQANQRIAALQAGARSQLLAATVLAGPGDIGRGGSTARGAVTDPTGVPGPGYVVSSSGQVIPVVGPDGSGGAVVPVGSQDQGGINLTVHISSVVPYTSDQARQVIGAAVAGIEGQKPRISSQTEVEL